MNNEKFDKAIEHFKQELGGLRTGRANPALVDNVMVDSYGSKMPLAHVASISIPDAKTIAIQPWDKSNIGPIEKAIQVANIGLNPVNDGILIRLSIPSMTEERRKEMVKLLGQISEKAKIAIRNAREEILKEYKKQQDEENLTEDDLAGMKKDLQEVVDKYNEQVKEITVAKEKEIMTI
ncbi:MAG: ribosome recycling factor [Patescibacteria group bacterium]